MKSRIRRKWLLIRTKYFDSFAFIHINKTAGSSIERALGLPFRHRTVQERIQEIGPKRWASRFTFAFVRNPWDRVVSLYHFRVKTNQTDLKDRPVAFEDWVELCFADRDPNYLDNPKMFMPQLEWLRDDRGGIGVDFVGRFEQLRGDFDHVCTEIGKTCRLPHANKTVRAPYRDYYTSRTRDLVSDWYRTDIDSFDYSF